MNPETYIAEHASAELRRREKKKEEASSLPRWLKDAKENVLAFVYAIVVFLLCQTLCQGLNSWIQESNQYPNTSLIQIENVNSKEEVAWYAGKRMAYIYKAKVKKNGSHYRCIWGKVTRPHGNSGVVRAKFKSSLPPRSMGARVRVFMYPSNI
ncbi:hypothetical protein V8G54_036184 [Vigna mungo]|uniref:Ribosomal protein L35A n=1 Tax=Vigna mungo TaxID=3915 RepID=A0AAQ3RGB2_VIGMU